MNTMNKTGLELMNLWVPPPMPFVIEHFEEEKRFLLEMVQSLAISTCYGLILLHEAGNYDAVIAGVMLMSLPV